MRTSLAVFTLLATPLLAEAQWRRFAPTTDFDGVTGTVAYEPVTATGCYIGTTATSNGASEVWRHVDGSWLRDATAIAPPIHGLGATWPGNGILIVGSAQTWLFDGITSTQFTIATPGVSAMAFDEARQRMVAVRSYPAFEVHEFDGTSWQLVSTAAPQFPNGQLAWHGTLQRVVLYGMNSVAHGCASWDGSAWTNHFAAMHNPLGHSFAAAPGGQVLASGGWNFNYGWGRSEVWDGTSPLPTSIDNLPNAPPPRGHSVSWFDRVQQRTIVTSFSENWTTWAWDGVAWSVSGAGAQPPSADNVVYDSWRGELLMAGGWSGPSLHHSDLWARRGTEWTRLGTGPFSPRRHANVAFDSKRGRLVLFGGAVHDPGAGAYYSVLETRTWEWDGSTWHDATPPNPTVLTHPRTRRSAAIAFDRARGRTVVFGGEFRTSGSAMTMNDTWEWDGTTWTLHTPATVPPTDASPSMAFDGNSGTCMLQALGVLWSWDGTNWTFAGTAPAGRLVDDPARGTLVVLQGHEAWELQGAAWVLAASRLSEGSAAFDLGRGAVVGIDRRATYELGDPAAATIRPFGNGCNGSNGAPVLHGEVPPRLGAALPLRVERLPAATLVVGVLGSDSATWLGQPLPLDLSPLGLTGCLLHAPVDVTVTLASGDWTIPLPAAPALIGASFRAQALVLDPPANAFGATTSNGVRVRLGA